MQMGFVLHVTGNPCRAGFRVWGRFWVFLSTVFGAGRKMAMPECETSFAR